MAEKRLIDANYLKKRLDDMEVRDGHKYYRAGMDDALHDFMPQFIDEQPTVDAVVVVRCKHCEYRCTDSCPTWYVESGTYRDKWALNNDDDFCSYGKKRTDV